MMNPEEVVRSVLEQHPQSGWGIFLLSKRKVITGLFVRLFYVLLFAIVGGVLLSDWLTTGSIANVPMQYRFYALILGCAAIVALWTFLKRLLLLFSGEKNMIVLTSDSLVVSFKGKITDYPYDKIGDLALSYISSGYNRSSLFLPQTLIKFTDLRDNSYITLDEDGVFGQSQEIHTLLKSKIT